MRPAISRPSSSRQWARKAAVSFGGMPAFCGSSPVLTSMNSLQALALALLLFGDGAGDLRAVDGVDGVEQLDGFAGLVRLQRADQVQFGIRVACAQVRPLRLGLLDAVLAEQALAGVEDGQ